MKNIYNTRVVLVGVLLFVLVCALMPGYAVGVDIARPEFPRPDFARSAWLNLNGKWEFQIDKLAVGEKQSWFTGHKFDSSIVVPFCPESKLSGIEYKGFMKNVWYRRLFSVPQQLKGGRLILHFGAVDYLARVWLNGHLLGSHTGGSTPFSFEITRWVNNGNNELVVHVFDDTASGLQAGGKQSQRDKSFGCFYTRTTGIWQTVWLEKVGSSYIEDFSVINNADCSKVILQLDIKGDTKDMYVIARAWDKGKIAGVAKMSAANHCRMVMRLSSRHLWWPGKAFLYDLQLTLTRKGKGVDTVKSYFGLRTVSIKGGAILINGKPVFQRLVLDQGFYPRGIWTAPNDTALKRDIELSLAAGFNGARCHQKVFEPRFLYWADKLGYMVWAEFPNWGLDYKKPQINLPVINEWSDELKRDRNHPCIIGWCPFNETSVSAGPLQRVVVKITRTIDPSRPVIESSGYAHTLRNPQVLDAHDYDQNPETFRQRWKRYFSNNSVVLPGRYGFGEHKDVPFFVSEYGGIGWFKKGSPAWGYGNNPQTQQQWFERYKGLTDALLDNRYMFGFCYTQLTDVEQERNGIYHYDRTAKFDVSRLKAINQRFAAYELEPPVENSQYHTTGWDILVGANCDGNMRSLWRYTFDKPGKNWQGVNFADSAWQNSYGGFGHKDGWENKIATQWTTSDIYLRTKFVCDNTDFSKAELVIHYDNDTQVYLNGKPLWDGRGWNDSYQGFDITTQTKKLLKKGNNTLAVHTHQDAGGQFIDLAVLVAR